MSITIHHGMPGSYKTSGAIQDNMVPYIKKGRPVVTNVRGLDNAERIKKVLKLSELPDITHVDTSTEEGRFKMATWFHWAPLGAFIFIDEVGTVYEDSFNTTKLKDFDFPDGINAAKEVGRAPTVKEAFEMHRHFNFDICVTSPDMRKVHKIITQCAEGAYRHNNKANIGLKGFYAEAYHLAYDSGNSRSHYLTVQIKKVKPYVFKLYESTATGQVQDSTGGKNLFLQPKVLFFTFAFFGSIIFLYDLGMPKMVSNAVSDQEVINSDILPIEVITEPDTSIRNRPPTSNLSNVDDFLKDYEVRYVGSFGYMPFPDDYFQLTSANSNLTVTKSDLRKLGYKFKAITDCIIKITLQSIVRTVTCNSSPEIQSTTSNSISSQFKI